MYFMGNVNFRVLSYYLWMGYVQFCMDMGLGTGNPNRL
jgi:hypothetical protein